MADHSVNELSSLINQQMQFQELLSECLAKAEVLTDVALGRDFLEHNKSVIHDYLSILNDMICQTREVNEDSLRYLLRQRKEGIEN